MKHLLPRIFLRTGPKSSTTIKRETVIYIMIGAAFLILMYAATTLGELSDLKLLGMSVIGYLLFITAIFLLINKEN